MMYSMINTSSSMRTYSIPKTALELMAVKLSQRESIVSINEIINRLNNIEKNSAKNIPSGFKPRQEAESSIKVDASRPSAVSAQGLETDSESRPELYRIREALGQVIKNIKHEKIYIASCLEEGRLVDFRNNTVVFSFLKKNTFHKESLEKPQNRELIESNFSKVLSEKIKVEFILTDDTESPTGSSGSDAAKNSKPSLTPLKKALSDPIIKTALDIFDGNIMKLF
jgi:hypothetical protein